MRSGISKGSLAGSVLLQPIAEIHDRILAARNAGAAVLLVSEDLDELLELADRLVVMFDGRIVHETTPATADIGEIGRCMAGHAAEPEHA